MRQLGAGIAVAALGALIAIGPPVPAARAASGSEFDQISGSGSTDSAVTTTWQDGLLDNTNKPITGSPAGELAPNADRANGTGPLSFMYQGLEKLQVTVSQTQDITQQGITVSWSGGTPTSTFITTQANFLQLMECYSDSPDGPNPEQCEFGTAGLLQGGTPTNPSIGSRGGWLCEPGAVASPPPTGQTGGGAPSADGGSPGNGCDPKEPGNASPPHAAPCPGPNCDPSHTRYDIPFVPADDPSSPVYAQDITQYFDQFDTNEVQEAVTLPDGTGRLQFETLTATGAPGLGCGELESSGQTRNCWLVIVPRGSYDPNGFEPDLKSTGSFGGYLKSSPLSASNWAMRIQVHLNYASVPAFCPPGTLETETAGSEPITQAMGSWELAVNKQANCKVVYGFAPGTEAESTQDLCTPASSTVGLAFTTMPIGTEAQRDDTGSNCPTGLPQILYAPVAVTAIALGFNISDGTGAVTTPVKMSPSLLAKSLTQVYRLDLPDYYPTVNLQGPPWSLSNPRDLSGDPEFAKLNPPATTGILPCCNTSFPTAPVLTEDQSALNLQVWQWIQADPATVAWLDKGTLSAGNTVAADPDYVKLQLGKPQLGTPDATDIFPRAYSGFLNLPPGGANTSGQTQLRHSLDLLPYVSNYSEVAQRVLTANNPASGTWDPSALSPSGGTGWWDTSGKQGLGQVFMWGISDTPDLAHSGLIDAQLCNDAGGNCVAPTTASVAAALASAKPDSAGLLQVNPASPGNSGYPLVQVIYAAVATNQSAAALNAYADLIAYAAGPGQTPGAAAGDLPPGYLPLTSTLQKQAQAVVAKLRAIANPPAGNPGATSSAGSAGGGGSGPGSAGGNGSSAGSVTPTPSSSPPAEFTISRASRQLPSATTPEQVVGAVRWALLVVVIVGAACATSGAALRSMRVPNWMRRRT
ncbi:MAG: hypothetical protein J2P27_05945 [Actinobacteria bacterium]|nr:hypothetical protein [Actinomycetota bacterium]